MKSQKFILGLACIFLIIFSACISKNMTVGFEYKYQEQPFNNCDSNVIQSPYLFTDPEKTFTIKVDSSWKYEHPKSDQGTQIYSFYSAQDKNLKLLIVVDDELYEEKAASSMLEHIFPKEGQKKITFNGDSCLWNSFYSAGTFTSKKQQHLLQSQFYYYNKINKRFYTIMICEIRKTPEKLHDNFACFYQKSIESFKAITN